jgi:hypothetical protein
VLEAFSAVDENVFFPGKKKNCRLLLLLLLLQLLFREEDVARGAKKISEEEEVIIVAALCIGFFSRVRVLCVACVQFYLLAAAAFFLVFRV